MNNLDLYLHSAERPQTAKSYAAAIRHFEVDWGGCLPASGETVAQYLADFAGTLAVTTLAHRVAALSAWHERNGAPNPTREEIVHRVMRGIRTLHTAEKKRARPLQLDVLQQVDRHLEEQLAYARRGLNHMAALRHARDRAMVLIGFWRGFRSDELVQLRVEHITLAPGEGLSCFVPRSKTDPDALGRNVYCPALSRLCPVSAYEDWLRESKLTAGPVFRGLNRWGQLREDGLATGSVAPLLRNIFQGAGVTDSAAYSSHSLRRGFANWANGCGWELQDLMAYVGWRKVETAMGYLDLGPAHLRARFERGLPSEQAPVSDGEATRPHLRIVTTKKP